MTGRMRKTAILNINEYPIFSVLVYCIIVIFLCTCEKKKIELLPPQNRVNSELTILCMDTLNGETRINL